MGDGDNAGGVWVDAGATVTSEAESWVTPGVAWRLEPCIGACRCRGSRSLDPESAAQLRVLGLRPRRLKLDRGPATKPLRSVFFRDRQIPFRPPRDCQEQDKLSQILRAVCPAATLRRLRMF